MNDLYLEFVVIPVIVFLIVYFLPTIMAKVRRHPSSSAIAALNFFLGWTVLGWIGAMVWAYTKSDSQRTLDAIEQNLERLDRARAIKKHSQGF